MLSLKLRSLVFVCLLTVAGVTAANAQLALGSSLKVNIPTSFIVNDKVMPAGEYSISRSPLARSIFILRGDKNSVFFRTQVSSLRDSSTETNIVLEKVGDSLYLSQINLTGTPAINIEKTKAQREALARSTTSKQTVALETGF